MKRSFKVLCLMLVIFMTSGCMKLNVDMSINKDKSMNLSYVVAFANSLIGQSGTDMALDESDLKQAEESGFKVENYSDGSMTGYKFTKDFLNIDSISDEKETVFDPNTIIDKEKLSDVFTVKKGFLKNTYTLNISAEETDETSNDISSDYTTTYTNDSLLEAGDQEDLLMMLSSMDIKFTINLPSKAISSNASSTSNDGKTLIWNPVTNASTMEKLECSFELYNMTTIYLIVGLVILVIIIIIVFVVKNNKKQKNNSPKGIQSEKNVVSSENSTQEQTNPTIPTNVQEMPSTPNVEMQEVSQTPEHPQTPVVEPQNNEQANPTIPTNVQEMPSTPNVEMQEVSQTPEQPQTPVVEAQNNEQVEPKTEATENLFASNFTSADVKANNTSENTNIESLNVGETKDNKIDVADTIFNSLPEDKNK